jgi:hypothetical protein
MSNLHGFPPYLEHKSQKKPATGFVAGFTIRSLTPVVTRLGRQFIASTFFSEPDWGGA